MLDAADVAETMTSAGCGARWPSLRSRSGWRAPAAAPSRVPCGPSTGGSRGPLAHSKPRSASLLDDAAHRAGRCCSVHGGWKPPQGNVPLSRPGVAARFRPCLAAVRPSRAPAPPRARPVGVWIVRERLAILPDRDPAARRVHHDRLDRARRDVEWPPNIDVARMSRGRPRGSFRWLRIAPQQPASSATTVWMPAASSTRGRAVDVGHHRRLHAAHQQQHLARVGARRPQPARGPASAAPCLQPAGNSRAHQLSGRHRRAEQRGRQALLQAEPQQPLGGRPRRRALLDDAPADVDQAPVLDPDGQVVSPVAAGEAAVQVQLRAARRRRALGHLLDQVDSAARAVSARRRATGRSGGSRCRAAVHALAQDGLGGGAVRRALEFGRPASSASELRKESTGLRMRVRVEGPRELTLDALQGGAGGMNTPGDGSRARRSSRGRRRRCAPSRTQAAGASVHSQRWAPHSTSVARQRQRHRRRRQRQPPQPRRGIRLDGALGRDEVLVGLLLAQPI